MSRKRRICGKGFTYHITTRCVHRKFLFSNETFLLILAILKRAKERYDFKLYGYTLMHNHYHLVLETNNDSVSLVMKYINRQISRQVNRQLGTRGHLWESRYSDSIIETNSYLLEVLAYIHLNPVRAGIVERAEDYPWSSYRGYIWDEPNELIDFPDVYFQLSKSPETRRQMVKAVTECKPKRKGYQSLLERRPDLSETIFYGSPEFVEAMKNQHATSLEPLRRYRRAALQRKAPTDPHKKSPPQ